MKSIKNKLKKICPECLRILSLIIEEKEHPNKKTEKKIGEFLEKTWCGTFSLPLFSDSYAVIGKDKESESEYNLFKKNIDEDYKGVVFLGDLGEYEKPQELQEMPVRGKKEEVSIGEGYSLISSQ